MLLDPGLRVGGLRQLRAGFQARRVVAAQNAMVEPSAALAARSRICICSRCTRHPGGFETESFATYKLEVFDPTAGARLCLSRLPVKGGSHGLHPSFWTAWPRVLQLRGCEYGGPEKPLGICANPFAWRAVCVVVNVRAGGFMFICSPESRVAVVAWVNERVGGAPDGRVWWGLRGRARCRSKGFSHGRDPQDRFFSYPGAPAAGSSDSGPKRRTQSPTALSGSAENSGSSGSDSGSVTGAKGVGGGMLT